MKTRNVLIVVIGLVIIALLFSPTPAPVVELPKSDPAPAFNFGTRIEGEGFEEAFIEGCLNEGASYPYCECGYEWLQNNISLEEFMDTEEEDMLELVLPAVSYCEEHLQPISDL